MTERVMLEAAAARTCGTATESMPRLQTETHPWRSSDHERAKQQFWKCVRADVRRVIEQERTFPAKLGRALVDPGLHAVLLYRVRHWLHEHHLQPLALLIGYVGAVFTGAQISARATIGGGLVIYHPYGLVIGATAVLGERCTLAGRNVIGQLFGLDDRPTIGDRFYAGTGAQVLGRIRIGNDVRVGPNAIVTRSLPDRVLFATAPGRIVPRRAPSSRREAAPTPGADGAAVRERIRQEIASFVATAVRGGAPMGPIADSMPFFEDGLGLNSIDFLALICALEERFGVILDERDEEVFDSVGSLAAFIEQQLAR